ncbi:hypothetical protein [uncultured Anaerofustis sp.]|uniref:hypothetical protein n=1 Tax=uncultured Anaerofustis sp. TaxID=904996 RepID=UPI0025FD5D02|nr:hypothetical protein [uncultured Anaerofustis sp.]
MSEIILTVDTPVLKGEKGDKGETGVFDYTHLEDIVDKHLDNRFQGVEDKISQKADKFPEGKDLVDKNVIKTFAGLEQWNDNQIVSREGEQITEDMTIIKVLNTKVDNQDLNNKVEEAKGEFQTYIDEKLVASGSGDMLKSVYDKDDDGIIDLAKQADNASRVNGKTVGTSVPENAVFTDTTYGEAAADKAGLMSISDKVKLNGIASGATRVEVVDALDSIEISKALSANQGKILNTNIGTLNTSLEENINKVSSNINTLAGRVGLLEEEQKILWSGGFYMLETQTIQLSEKISQQKNGIVLLFSAYNNEPVDWGLHSFFIPKINYFGSTWAGQGLCFNLMMTDFLAIGSKYLYIGDQSITGASNNIKVGTASGISFRNNYWVLRGVIGC